MPSSFTPADGHDPESLPPGRWRQAEGLARVNETFASSPEERASAQVGRWLARDLGLGADAVRDEVLSWDVTGLPDECEVAKLLLLHRDDDALIELRDFLASRLITTDDLDT